MRRIKKAFPANAKNALSFLNKYYKVKNSWTAEGIYEGYFYASEAFVRYKTMNIMINKNAVPKAIRKKFEKK